jgi:CubicO group peptidase (beta-lactamase class C family)
MVLKDKVDALLRTAAEAGDVPGVVATATTHEGTIYEGGFGSRILGEPAEMSPDTVVWIASMTKALTGTAAMQLVEQVSLNSTLRQAVCCQNSAKSWFWKGSMRMGSHAHGRQSDR